MSQIITWRGDAQGVSQIVRWIITLATWGDEFIVTMNGKTVSYTADEDDMSSVLNDDSDSRDETASETSMRMLAAALVASQIPEFKEVTFTAPTSDTGYAATTSITATGSSVGQPFTAALSSNDAGSTILVETLTEGSAGENEIQKISISGTSGTFTLTFSGQTTSALTFDESAADIETALEALSNITAGDVVVTGDDGGPWYVEFDQNYANQNVSQISGDGTNLDGGQSVSVVTSDEGAGVTNEIQQMDLSLPVPDATYFEIQITEPAALGGRTTNVQAFVGSSAATWESSIQSGISVYNSGDCIVTEVSTNVFTIEFTGGWAGQAMVLCTDVDPPAANAQFSQIQAGSGSGSSEVQVITLTGGPVAGTFTLDFEGQTTSALTFDESAADIETALEALSNITSLTVTGDDGGPWTVTFDGTPSGDVSELTGDASNLTGGSVDVETYQDSEATMNEQQRVTVLGSATGGTFDLTANPIGGGDETTGALTYDESAADIKTALEALASWTSGDCTVTGDDGGPWLIEYTGTWAAQPIEPLTGDGAGLTGSGDQTFTETSDQSPTGPNWFDEAANWSLGRIPADGDTIVFENSEVDCLYGLDHSEIDPFAVYVEASMTGAIGLERRNDSYWEYRPDYLRLGAAATAGSHDAIQLRVGFGPGSGSGRVKINTGDRKTITEIISTASSSGSSPAVLLLGTHEDNELSVYRGTVGVAFYADEVAVMSKVRQAHRGNPESDTEVTIGAGCDVRLYEKTGGIATITLDAGTTVERLTNDDGDATIFGQGRIDDVNVGGGNLTSNSSGSLGKRGDISGITAANPAVVTSSVQSFDAVFQEDSSGETFVDETVDANDAGAGDWDFFPAGSGEDDAAYFGSTERFSKVSITVATSGAGTYTVTWELWDGVSWVALTSLVDGTSAFKAAPGAVTVTFDAIRGWRRTVVNDSAPLFFIRARRDDGTVTTDPVGTVGTVAVPHGLTTGNGVRIGGVVGMIEVNQNEYLVEVVDDWSFKLVGLDASAFTAYSSSGVWGLLGSVVLTGDAFLDFGQSLEQRTVAVAVDVHNAEAKIENSGHKVVTETYLTGEFAVDYHDAAPDENLPQDGVHVFRRRRSIAGPDEVV